MAAAAVLAAALGVAAAGDGGGGAWVLADNPSDVTIVHDCGEDGQVLFPHSQEETVVTDWVFSGNCSILGGTLVGQAGGAALRFTSGSLWVQGTTFRDVRIEFDGWRMEIVNASFEATTSRMATTDATRIVGGAIRVGPGRLTSEAFARIVGTVFSRTYAQLGGAIAFGIAAGGFRSAPVGNGVLKVEDCEFSGTRATMYGGAICVAGGHVKVERSRFFDTQAMATNVLEVQSGGGAIAAVACSYNVTLCSFVQAQSYQGGAVHISSKLNGISAQLARSFGNIHSSKFVNCTGMNGGVLFASKSNVILDKVTVEGAKATALTRRKDIVSTREVKGGVICSLASAIVSIRHSFFRDVTSDAYGGAIFDQGSDLGIYNLTMVNVKAQRSGGGIYQKAEKCRKCYEFPFQMLTIENAEAMAGGAYFGSGTAKQSFKRHAWRNLRFRNVSARDGYGGAIYVRRMRVHIDTAEFHNTTTVSRGGAIALESVDDALLVNVAITKSSAREEGGGIFLMQTKAHVDNLTVASSESRSGAALAGLGSNITATSVTMRDLYAEEFGGAIWLLRQASLEARYLTIENTSAADQGGAVWAEGSSVSFYNASVQGASASIEGGGLYIVDGRVVIANSSVGALAPDSIMAAYSKVTLRNVALNITRGRFASLLDCTYHWENVLGSCPIHAELRMDKTRPNAVSTLDSLAQSRRSSRGETEAPGPAGTFYAGQLIVHCRKCEPNEGIFGRSSFASWQKCFSCPMHSFGFEDQGCRCKNGFALNSSNNSVAGSRCNSCNYRHLRCQVEGAQLVCPPGSPDALCHVAWPEDGYWKTDDSVASPVLCPFGPACRRSLDSPCSEGYEGPLCMVCQRGRYRQSRYMPCGPCTDAFGPIHKGAVLLLCGALLLSAVLSRRVKLRSEETAIFVKSHMSYMGNKLRLVLLTMQAASTMRFLRVQSTEVMAIFTPYLHWISFDIFPSQHFALCVLGAGTYAHYILVLLQIPLVFFTLSYVSVVTKSNVNTLRLLFYNIMLTTITEESLDFFACDWHVSDMTGEAYLMRDYTVACKGATLRVFQATAGLVLVAWCGAIPGFLLYKMWSKRDRINPQVSGPLDFELSSDDRPAIKLHLVAEHEAAMHCYGKATVRHFRSALMQEAKDEQRLSPEELGGIGAAASKCARRRLNSTHLLKLGLRAAAEFQDPELKALRHFYASYQPARWYYEFIGIYGRIAIAATPLLSSSLQCLFGSLVVGVLLLSLMLGPFIRQSDTVTAAACYASLLGLFISHSVNSHTNVCNYVTGICLVMPVATAAFFVVKAYILPGRHSIWTVEAADRLFNAEYCCSQGLDGRPTQPPNAKLPPQQFRRSATNSSSSIESDDSDREVPPPTCPEAA